jgi:DNA-binding XRE family transcriptional regulator
LVKAFFADGSIARVPIQAIPGLRGRVTGVSLPGPIGVLVHCGKSKIELPWDWLRGFADPSFAEKARTTNKESALAVGKRIATRRHEQGWSQSELASKSGVDRSTIARSETGEQMPSYGTLVALSTAFGCSIAELLTEP